MSRHRSDMDLHYGRNDFANQDRLVRFLSRDRAKDMASDYEQIGPTQDYAERRGITFRARIAEIVRKVVLERKVSEDSAEALRQARTKALIRHARALDAVLATEDADGIGSPSQVRELKDARKAFDELRSHGRRDAEAAYAKNSELIHEASTGQVNRAVRALQLETELRTDPHLRADRVVEQWQKLDRAGQRQYQAGDMSGYKATRSAIGDMAKSLQRNPQLESLLANRKAAPGINMETGRRLGAALAFSHGLNFGRGRGVGL